MITRRAAIVAAIAGLTGAAGAYALSARPWTARYEAAAQALWRHSASQIADAVALRRELIRYATLAPSSHNTQCWRFALEPARISIMPDLTRRCPVVDPDDHHLYVSLGCAAENLAQAALAHGFNAEASFDAHRDAIDFALAPTEAFRSDSFKAITTRQCTRGEYDGKPLSAAELDLLAKVGSSDDVSLLLLTEKPAMERVLEFVIDGNTRQMHDAAFVAELKAWIRFNGATAVRSSDGLYAASSGNPTLPTWLGLRMFDLAFKPAREKDKYARHVRSSAGIAVFVARNSGKADWIEVGRCYEKFALQAAALGIRNAMINPPVEVAALRAQFGAALGIAERRPDLVVRFGRGALLPPSLRRPVAEVLIG